MSVDKDTMQATFGAGTTFHEVNAILDDLGLALPVLGSISDQTVAGAISTGMYVKYDASAPADFRWSGHATSLFMHLQIFIPIYLE